MSDMDERIERAARALDEANGNWADEWYTDQIVGFVLRAALPELLDGTAWVAPMEPTAAMRVAGWPHFSALGDKPNGALEFADRRYRAMRDAHLKGQETDSKVEG